MSIRHFVHPFLFILQIAILSRLVYFDLGMMTIENGFDGITSRIIRPMTPHSKKARGNKIVIFKMFREKLLRYSILAFEFEVRLLGQIGPLSPI